MATETYDVTGRPIGRPARSNNWQDWANLVLAIWLFISPWVLAFGAGNAGGNGGGASVGNAAWDAWVLGVIVFLVSLSAISRMEYWQERVNVVLAIWIFIAPWVLGFTQLGAASWDHWIVGVLVFLISLSMLSGGSRSAVPPADTTPRSTL